ncbi:5-formyltetrahydrofolate cyclo-ligase [Mangrovicoccus ximenensis]|uniref:5-formyltetrahydrofolate cyclo-ligase n=1 Tax=Mangrovicoccus ximenensis TaxID=1911570 RepID=UPI001374D0BD|nr:5-formyltetrahydrofolate cyclo-ligase [Mangrovicoccus ximenensis]
MTAALRLAAHRLCLPVTHGRGHPLSFHLWSPGVALQSAGFGTSAPVEAPEVVPDVLVVPMLAFDGKGGRMGYGAGHYDRTLDKLRALGPVRAYGFAYAAQEFDALPQEPTDQPLDGIVTENGLIRIL